MAQEDVFKKIVSHCKEYGFVFPSSEIYDGLGAVYDYGQNGVELKNNIKQYWWQSMVLLHENIVGIDSAIFMHPTIWKASGHVDAFNDPLIDNRDSKKRYRADVLIEDQIAKYEEKIDKEVAKARKRFGDAFDEAQFRSTNPRVLEHQQKRDALHERYTKAMQGPDLAELKKIIEDEEIVDPISGTKNWTDVRQFNLMFSTEMGSTSEGAMKVYLRPETAQGIFVNYLNVQKTGRMKIPFGIAQIGKAFRNEIVARQFIFRMREFEQMEMQFFVQPGTELEYFQRWKELRMKWHQALGFGAENYRFHDHEKLAHYANAATDIEFKMPFGFKEVEGVHSRTNFDLSQHEKFSGRSIKYFDPQTKESYTPYVIETSIGVDRMFLSVMCHSYREEKLENGETRVVLLLPPALAPTKLAVLPLVKKDGLPEKAREIVNNLKFHFNTHYDEKDTIVEIRAGVGGDEAGIFAGDLFKMYERFAASKGWKVEVLSSSPSDAGGFKTIEFKVTGDKVYSVMKYESGVHRVQRVPKTESQGRIQTSTATVAVLPEADEIDIQIDQSDLRIDTYCASGPGGQCVNTTYSAVRITHLPTNTVVQSQDQRSQIQNREVCMQMLRARLYEMELERQQAEQGAERQSQIGHGNRSEKIRTYNQPQDRVTDHRIGFNSTYNAVLLGSGLSDVIEALAAAERAEKLAEQV